MPRPSALLLLAVSGTACLHGRPRPVEPGTPFALDAVTVKAPGGPGWTVEEAGAAGAEGIRFRRAPGDPREAAEALASQVPLPVRPGGPADFLELVREEVRAAWGMAEERRLQLTGFDARLDGRFGPLGVVVDGRARPEGPPPGRHVVLVRELSFVLPERPERRYRIGYLEAAPEWSPGTGFRERAEAFFAGVAVRPPAAPGALRATSAEAQVLALGPAVARLRGLGLLGVELRFSARSLFPARAEPGGLGVELGLDLFAGRTGDERRGGFSLAASALAFRSLGAAWLGGGLDLGYAATTYLQGGPRSDGLAVGPHLAAGWERRAEWGALTLRLDLLAATPHYYRAGLLGGMLW